MDKVKIGHHVQLGQWDLIRDLRAYPEGPVAHGRNVYSVIGSEGAFRGSLLLSDGERDAIKAALRAHGAIASEEGQADA